MQKYLRKQKIILNWKNFWQKYRFLSFFLLFIFSFVFLFWLQNSKSFADPDSFYHAKTIWMMKEKIANGQLPIFKEFPWLYYTVLKINYIDHHFLYHLLSIPFLLFTQILFKFPLFSNASIPESYQILIGFKLVTVFWATLFITTFYWLLKKIKIKGAIYYSLLLLITTPFIFRLSLGKATAASLIFLFLGIYFCQKRKLWPLFGISFFYVWLYGGWPLMIAIVTVFIISDAISHLTLRSLLMDGLEKGSYLTRTTKKITIKTLIILKSLDNKLTFRHTKRKTIRSLLYTVRYFFIRLFSRQNIKLFFTVIGGLAAGLIINPYFPKNIIFYYYQIYEIAIKNYQDILNVGGEWYPYGFFNLITASSLSFILAILALAFFVINLIYYFKKNKGQQKEVTILIFSLILAIILLILTLRSRRNVEYFFPFLTIFIATSFNLAIKNFYSPKIWRKIWKNCQKQWLITGIISGFIVVAVPFVIYQDTSINKKQLTSGFTWDNWQGASVWLKNNTTPGDIIFHNDWDDWPFLFFHNDQNYYIVGLDPTFMYNFDKKLYQEWSDATLGQNTTPLHTIVSEKFNSQYVLVDTDHIALEQQLIADGNFKRVYVDEKTRIYKLILTKN